MLIVGGCSCSSSSEVSQSSTEHGVPPDFKMVLGEGGGMTGYWSGYTIVADGSIVEWNGPVAGSNERPAGTLQASETAAIWRDIIETEFFDQEIDERGEITAFVKVIADSIEHRVSWVPGVENIEPPRNPVEEMYRRTRKIAQKAAGMVGETL